LILHRDGGVQESDTLDEIHNVPIDDTIDLHSFSPRDVGVVVEEYLYQAHCKGLVQVRIIHGRGIGVQRKIVHSILRKDPHVRSFRDMPDRGSTVADLATNETPAE